MVLTEEVRVSAGIKDDTNYLLCPHPTTTTTTEGPSAVSTRLPARIHLCGESGLRGTMQVPSFLFFSEKKKTGSALETGAAGTPCLSFYCSVLFPHENE